MPGQKTGLFSHENLLVIQRDKFYGSINKQWEAWIILIWGGENNKGKEKVHNLFSFPKSTLHCMVFVSFVCSQIQIIEKSNFVKTDGIDVKPK